MADYWDEQLNPSSILPLGSDMTSQNLTGGLIVLLDELVLESRHFWHATGAANRVNNMHTD